jgi:hypothetical protein
MGRMSTYTHTDLLSHALMGYEQRKTEVADAIAQIRAMLDGAAPTVTPSQPAHRTARKRRTMSPAARKRMALLMRQRWAKARRAGRKRLG